MAVLGTTRKGERLALYIFIDCVPFAELALTIFLRVRHGAFEFTQEAGLPCYTAFSSIALCVYTGESVSAKAVHNIGFQTKSIIQRA